MAKLLLNVTLVDLGRTGQTSTQAMSGKQRKTLFLGQVRSNTGVQDRALDQARDMFVVQPCCSDAFAIPRYADKDRPEVDLGKVQPVLQRMHGTGLIARPTANLDLAPHRLGVEGQQGPLVKDFDSAARIRRVILVNIKTDNL